MEAAVAAPAQTTEQPVSTVPSAPVVEASKPKEEVDYSARFAELTKKEKSILERQKQIKEKSKALEDFETAKKNAKLNPKAFLEANGLTYQELTEFLLNDEKPSEQTVIKSELDMIKAELAEEKKRREEEKQSVSKREEERAVGEFKSSIAKMAESDDYELVRSSGEMGIDLVYSVMEEYFEVHQTMMDKADALKQVEAYIENDLKSKYQNAKKIKSWWENEPAKETKDAGTRQTDEPYTLTNKATLAGHVDQPRHLDDDETSKRKAADLLRSLLAKQK